MQERWIIYKPVSLGDGFKVVKENVVANTSYRPQNDTFDGYKCEIISRELFDHEMHSKKVISKADRKQYAKEYLKTERKKLELLLLPNQKDNLLPTDAWPATDKTNRPIKLLRKSKSTLNPEHLTRDPALTQIKQHQSYYSALRSSRQDIIEKLLDKKWRHNDEDDEQKMYSVLVTSEQILSKSKIKRVASS